MHEGGAEVTYRQLTFSAALTQALVSSLRILTQRLSSSSLLEPSFLLSSLHYSLGTHNMSVVWNSREEDTGNSLPGGACVLAGKGY